MGAELGSTHSWAGEIEPACHCMKPLWTHGCDAVDNLQVRPIGDDRQAWPGSCAQQRSYATKMPTCADQQCQGCRVPDIAPWSMSPFAQNPRAALELLAEVI